MFNVAVFVANDRILHYLAPFLASFRRYMPNLPAILISYDDNVDQTRILAAHYDVQVVASSDVDPIIAELSQTIYRRDVGHLKKMHSFTLDVDNVLIIDVDIIILKTFENIMTKFAESNFDIAFGEQTKQYVYSAEGLQKFPLSKLFSCGVIIASPRKIKLHQIRDVIIENYSEFMACKDGRVQEQPIVNYFIDKSEKRAVSFQDLDDTISSYNYYLRKDIKIEWGSVSPKLSIDGKELLLLHFAGLKDTSGEFRFKDLVEYYHLLCTSRFGSKNNER